MEQMVRLDRSKGSRTSTTHSPGTPDCICFLINLSGKSDEVVGGCWTLTYRKVIEAQLPFEFHGSGNAT